MEEKLYLPNGQHITYKYILDREAMGNVELMYLHGFYGAMDGTKGSLLDIIADENDMNLIKLNYLGHGTSSGSFVDFTMTDWLNNIRTVIDKISKKKLILVGSSMGGWLAYLIALEYGEKIKSIVTVATAVDFLTDVIEPKMGNNESYTLISETSGKSVFTRKQLEDSRQYNLMDKGNININCPVRMVHGLKDDIIPYETPLKFFKKVNSGNAEFKIVKEMDHRLSLGGNLGILRETINSVID